MENRDNRGGGAAENAWRGKNRDVRVGDSLGFGLLASLRERSIC